MNSAKRINQSSCLSDIPDEIFMVISEFLPYKDFSQFMMISKRLYRALNHRWLYKTRLETLLNLEEKHGNVIKMWEELIEHMKLICILTSKKLDSSLGNTLTLFELYPSFKKEYDNFIQGRKYKEAYDFLSDKLCCPCCSLYVEPSIYSMISQCFFNYQIATPGWMKESANENLFYTLFKNVTRHSPQYSPQYSAVSPQYSPSYPQYDLDSSTPDSPVYTHDSPQYTLDSPQYSPSLPQYTSSSLQYDPKCEDVVFIDLTNCTFGNYGMDKMNVGKSKTKPKEDSLFYSSIVGACCNVCCSRIHKNCVHEHKVEFE